MSPLKRGSTGRKKRSSTPQVSPSDVFTETKQTPKVNRICQKRDKPEKSMIWPGFRVVKVRVKRINPEHEKRKLKRVAQPLASHPPKSGIIDDVACSVSGGDTVKLVWKGTSLFPTPLTSPASTSSSSITNYESGNDNPKAPTLATILSQAGGASSKVPNQGLTVSIKELVQLVGVSKFLAGLSERKLLSMMREECENPEPHLSLLSNILESTFKSRKKLTNAVATAQYLFTKYPALKIYEMLKEEYGRVTHGDPSTMRKLERQLDPVILEFRALKVKSFRPSPGILLEIKKKWKELDLICSQSNEDFTELKQVLGMLALAFYWLEDCVVTDLCKILRENEDLTEQDQSMLLTPTLVFRQSQMFDVHTEMWVYIEGVKFLKVPNLYEGFLCIYASYYAFNFEYEKELKPLFRYFDFITSNL